MIARLALCALVVLAACGPVSRRAAERQCYERARLAEQPRGMVGLGVASDGSSRARGKITISSDFLMGRDPSEVFNSCFRSLTRGEFPSRTYADGPPL